MKSVLFIAYDFPPFSSTGGSVRSEKFVKYLPEFGFSPLVLAKGPTQRKNINQNTLVQYFDSRFPVRWPFELRPFQWASLLPRAVRALLEEHSVDIIYVSAPPFPSSISAVALSRELQKPVIVDFRDAWVPDPIREGSLLKRFYLDRIAPFSEEKVFSGASLFLANTPSMLSVYQEQYPAYKHKMRFLPNGFDEGDFSYSQQVQEKNSLFRLVYTGTIVGKSRKAKELFCALQALAHKGLKFQFDIYGPISSELSEMVKQYELNKYVSLKGVVGHKQALGAMQSADALVVYQQPSHGKVTPIAGKTYEYIRSGKPLLAIVPPGDNADLIKTYSRHSQVVLSYSVEEIVKAIEVLSEQENTFVNVETSFRERFDRRRLTEKLSEFMEELLRRCE